MISHFKTTQNTTITLEYDVDDTIENIKIKLSGIMKIPWNELFIIFCGKNCENQKKADFYKFWKENCAHVIHRKPI